MEIFWELHKDLTREGPGNEASTLKALAYAKGLPEHARVLDLGCGPGAQTISLAKALKGSIIAMDLHEPFLAQLKERAEKEGLASRINARKGDMGALEFEPDSFDLIWSEGAIYNIGFKRGLEEWRRYLKPGGYMAVSELCWLRKDPPEELAAYWAFDYPAMQDIGTNTATIAELGYGLAGHFSLPEECWLDEYYGPLGKRIAMLRSLHAGDAEAMSALELCQQEIDLYGRYSDYYGYEFFIMEL